MQNDSIKYKQKYKHKKTLQTIKQNQEESPRTQLVVY